MFAGKAVMSAAVALAIVGCAQMPTAPTIAVMPAPGMPFDVFQQDNYQCQMYARQTLGGNARNAANQQVAAGAVAGTVIGAAAGALIGGNSNAAGAGAATGLLFGSAAGAGSANQTTYGLQRRYNLAYAQCMYAKGNQVPGYAAPQYVPPPPPGSSALPPPPAGTPPPPPPGVRPPSVATNGVPATA